MKPNPSRNKSLRAPRARFHDYRAKGYYLITMTAYEDALPLSVIAPRQAELLRKGEVVLPDLTPLGQRVLEELLALTVRNPALVIGPHVVMPDHIHFILRVTTRLEKAIGSHIASFAHACSKAYTELAGLPKHTTLFQPFDDSIIFDAIQLDRAKRYIEDNPRKYLLRRRYPDLFRRHLHLVIDGHEYAAYGNLFLLKAPRLLPVRVHRRWSQGEFDSYGAKCRAEISMGAIPITPAIHPAERQIVRDAIDGGSSVILLRDLSFGERFKPQGEQFDLCTAGRLLLLSPWPDNLRRRSTAGYAEFHTMNDHAAAIAALPASARLSLRLDSPAEAGAQ